MAKKLKKTKKAQPEKPEYEVSSGNIYADFGFPKPEEVDAKSDLAILIRSAIKDRGLTQKEAAELMGIDQPKISKITRGLLSEFTIERLMRFLLSLGFDIGIDPVKSKKGTTPSIHVVRSNNTKRLRV